MPLPDLRDTAGERIVIVDVLNAAATQLHIAADGPYAEIHGRRQAIDQRSRQSEVLYNIEVLVRVCIARFDQPGVGRPKVEHQRWTDGRYPIAARGIGNPVVRLLTAGGRS